MNNKENCEIVQDLLPNYIEKLTSEESTNFIETHLKNCTECSTIFENMKKDLEKENANIKKDVKYAKKYNRKINILILIIVVILLVVFSATFLRNAIIIKSLSKKSSNYDNCNNFHITWSTYNNQLISVFDIYYKDGKYLEKMYMFSYNYEETKEIVSKARFYYDGISDKRIVYYDNEKVLSYEELDKDSPFKKPTIMPINMSHLTLFEETPLEFIKACLTNQITLEKCNNIESYRFNRLNDDINALYVDKETGLSLRNQSGGIYQDNYSDTFSDVIYEFNTVTDEDVSMPSTEGYTIQE